MRLLLGSPLSPSDITLLGDSELSTLALGQGYPWLDALANDEDVCYPAEVDQYFLNYRSKRGGVPRCECAVKGILHVYDIETTNVLFTVNNDTRPTHVTTTGDHDNVTGIEFYKVGDLSLFKIKLDGVIDLNERVGVTNGTAIVSDDVGNTLSTNGNLPDLEELVGSLLGCDAVDGETAFDIVEETEVFTRLLNSDNV